MLSACFIYQMTQSEYGVRYVFPKVWLGWRCWKVYDLDTVIFQYPNKKYTSSTTVEACEMWFLRSLLKVSWTLKITNGKILRKSEFRFYSLAQKYLMFGTSLVTKNMDYCNTFLWRIGYETGFFAKEHAWMMSNGWHRNNILNGGR